MCTGLAWTRRVRALSRSERVPDDRIVFKKCASEALCPADEDAYCAASAERRDAARSVREASWDAEGCGRSGFGGRGGREENQEDEGAAT